MDGINRAKDREPRVEVKKEHGKHNRCKEEEKVVKEKEAAKKRESKRKAEDPEHEKPVKKPKTSSGPSPPPTDTNVPAKRSALPILDNDMDPATAELIASMVVDAPLAESIKMNRRRPEMANTKEGRSFAFFGEEGKVRKKKVKKEVEDAGKEGDVEEVEEEITANGTLEAPEEITTPVTPATPSDSSSLKITTNHASTPIIYIPTVTTHANASTNAAAERPRKRKRFDMPPYAFISSQIEDILLMLPEDRTGAAAKVAILAEYCTSESLFRLLAYLLRLEAIMLDDNSKLENAGEFEAFAEARDRGGKFVGRQIEMGCGMDEVKTCLAEMKAWLDKSEQQ